eukprot:TRINITY_DN6052_c0_g1_i1.p1 TRINITY_DN6052_c0_g1~~TRINITY_DN6052_c0_g1_i1.p1  ORF type:complete len:893 (-),score=159.75 TRINITY_DN6052_c0_g1_i1:53-2662(-)
MAAVLRSEPPVRRSSVVYSPLVAPSRPAAEIADPRQSPILAARQSPPLAARQSPPLAPAPVPSGLIRVTNQPDSSRRPSVQGPVGSPQLAASPQLAVVRQAAGSPVIVAQRRVSVASSPSIVVHSPSLGPIGIRESRVLLPGAKPSTAAVSVSTAPARSSNLNSSVGSGSRDDVDLPESALTGSGGSSRNSTQGTGGACASASAPSAALVAAVQLAAAASATPQAQIHQVAQAPPTLPLQQARPSQASPVVKPQDAPLAAGRRRWASMTEEEIVGGTSRRSSVDFAGYLSPNMSPALGPGFSLAVGGGTSSSMGVAPSRGYDAYAGGARRRWASISDDEACSPCLWPMRSPLLRVQKTGGRRSQSSTPLLGPAQGLAKVSEHAAAGPSANFMLPPTQQATQVPQAPAEFVPAWQGGGWDGTATMVGGFGGLQASVGSAQPWSQQPQQQLWMVREGEAPQLVQQPWAGGQAQGQWTTQAPAAIYAGIPAQAMQQHPGFGPAAAPVDAASGYGWMVPGTSEMAAQVWLGQEQGLDQQQLQQEQLMSAEQMQMQASLPQRGGRALNGWSVVWIGERAFRAPAAQKEQIENLGFMVKVYRSHDRCSRALDKKAAVTATSIFLVSEADAVPLLEYLRGRRANGLRVVVDAEGFSPQQAWQLSESLPQLEEGCVTRVCGSWDEVLAVLSEASSEVQAQSLQMYPAMYMGAAMPVPGAQAAVASASQPPAFQSSVEAQGPGAGGGSSDGGNNGTSENPWTLVWISDQAFKPTATSMKAQLESLGCQVKGYKTHKNAARALDKKRALVRTVVLVSGQEAAPFLAYISSRSEMAHTPVVVEASSRSVPVREGPNVQVLDSFDSAAAACWKIANDPGFC